MIVGSLVVAFILILIGWTKEIIFGIFGENSFASTLTIWLAVISIYVLDFAINIVQATSRALIVDCLPPSQQEEGTAWAGKMGVIGSAMGYFMGFVELPAIFPFFGNTNLKVLCILASLVLLSCNALTWWAVKEKVNYDGSQKESISVLSYTFETITSVVKSIRNLPEPVQNICNVQFFAWIGWFPFLIYSTTWVAEVYTRTVGKPSSEVGTRAGSFALLVHSLVSLMASFLLPFIISPSGDTKFTCTNRSHFNWENLRLPLPFLTLPKMWTLSHFIVAFVMLGTWFTNTVAEATFLYGILGISWATAMWAPFSLLGEFIAKNSRQLGTGSLQCNNEVVEPDEISYGLVETTNIQSEEHLVSFTGDYDSSQISCDAGTLLGIHNIYIVLPQFLVTFFSSVVFAIIEPGSEKSLVDEVDVNSNKDAIGFVLRFGGLMALIAGILSIKLWKA
ncbi:hypothetical protein G9A89_015480 [Geosiphon pyriformis]|nr:hypothetical protein G9A89_015480 [Geosiphon pyriformis]